MIRSPPEFRPHFDNVSPRAVFPVSATLMIRQTPCFHHTDSDVKGKVRMHAAG